MAVELKRPPAPDVAKSGSNVESVRIEPAEGGYIVSCSKREASKMDGPTAYAAPVQKVFASLAEVKDYLESELGDGEAAAEATEESTE